ncbi:MAG: asparagine synthase C-terminal domain-containing protein [Parabacteroides sp.]|nr:asparagine synthase C-terminal domain-containing protein [Parabacteroides sp.]
MVHILTENNRIHSWTTHSQEKVKGYVKGYAFYREELLQEKGLFQTVQKAWKENQIDKILSELNGQFCLILQEEDQTILIADKIRSYPLFYLTDGNNFIITDTGDTAYQSLPHRAWDKTAVLSYLSVGYMNEGTTLFQNCHVVPASAYVVIGKEITVRHYYTPMSLFPLTQPEAIFKQSKQALEAAFNRMLESIGDKTVVLPLSGGYDSRLLACLCKQFNVQNVICYTYGIAGSPEIEISEKVAQQLGFPWHYVEYTKEKWKEILTSPIFEAYMRYAGNLNAIPHLQDFLAIHELRTKQIIPENAVVVPGHTGDVIGGSHLPLHIQKDTIVSELYDKYFTINILKSREKRFLTNSLEHFIQETYPTGNEQEYYQAFHLWGIQSRQANFIINSVRLYEFQGLDWRVPLWDDAFEQVWNAVPYKQRVGSSLYNKFLFDTYFTPNRVAFHKTEDGNLPSPCTQFIRNMISNEKRYYLKRILNRMHLYSFPKDINALDIVGELLMKEKNLQKHPYLRTMKPNSMCMKALYYLSLYSEINT